MAPLRHHAGLLHENVGLLLGLSAQTQRLVVGGAGFVVAAKAPVAVSGAQPDLAVLGIFRSEGSVDGVALGAPVQAPQHTGEVEAKLDVAIQRRCFSEGRLGSGEFVGTFFDEAQGLMELGVGGLEVDGTTCGAASVFLTAGAGVGGGEELVAVGILW